MTAPPRDLADGGRVFARAGAEALRPPRPADRQHVRGCGLRNWTNLSSFHWAAFTKVRNPRAELARVTAELDAAQTRLIELLRELEDAYSMIELLQQRPMGGVQ